ncbi:alpha/beta fold hydrolase [Mycobacterium avium subsp. hominissuis]|uniref:alpha/beta fold hydrolase n=1 Tax=Mycobacterium avium TaxID=1764 RepID=UPI0003922F96|nr:alpha/beta fold hydrolase [Mycobacterium avium]APA74889.1 alpha/beta fold hydrolase [Mycobacterium avium subsp. hominissuis]ATO69672.1 alpha/beta fold hydrolase [Mycobacterium avium subsp. hominissuis]ATO74179.1 alpha/beta fold hydrolase [Mycobacterium avium subsp. hominissuis]PBJ63381.1 alpha/beta hydrolase [Mycobacterium avium subsp. hominissuis]QNR39401.1 alpha/beta hydrolase [Mycobacterium avium subsp. hominissuis]
MAEPGWIDVTGPAGDLKALTWGPPDGSLALCLHGFPDTPYGWRKLAPRLADAGWRVVAPFMRGYAPSAIPSDGSYHVGALMDDALRVRAAAGGTDNDVVIGHDWGAIAATGLAAMPDSPFAKAVLMSVPPSAAFRRRGGSAAERGRLAAHLARQVFRSWYILYFQLPWLPERSASWVLPLLWRRWSPGYRAEEDLRHVDAAIGAPESWRAALGPYRATIRNTAPPAQYATLHRLWTEEPVLPCLYLHGRDDGCMTSAFAHQVEKVLSPGSEVDIVEHAGHFLQLEQPDKVAGLVLGFIGSPR